MSDMVYETTNVMGTMNKAGDEVFICSRADMSRDIAAEMAMSDPLPECMAPDGAQPCRAYTAALLKIDEATKEAFRLAVRAEEAEALLDDAKDRLAGQLELIDYQRRELDELRELRSASSGDKR